MNRKEVTIILVYVLAQLSSFIGVPLLFKYSTFSSIESIAYWSIFSMSAAAIVSLFLSHSLTSGGKMGKPAPLKETIFWIIFGVFLAYSAQIIAAVIEQSIFHIPAESENTKDILKVATEAPIFMFVGIVLAPFLEELIFRRIIFYHLYQKFSFLIAAIISSLIFAILHMDFSHILVYLVMGIVFSFLYVKTNRIIVPIIAHMLMNGTVFYLAFAVHQ